MSESHHSVTAAAVQATPVFLNREETLAKAVGLIEDAASNGAELIALPEAFIAGYPYWLWGGQSECVPNLEQRGFATLWREAIDVPGPETARLGEAAQNAGACLVVGVNERESAYGRATLYNTVLTIGADGRLLGRHRKLVPTYRERTVWGQGDGSTLQVVPTPFGRIGTMICWENYMPLARYHQYAQGEQIHVAPTADASAAWGHVMRAIATEGRVYVISVCQYFARSQFSDEPLLSGFAQDDEVLSEGNSMIVAPDGSVLAGPLSGGEGILYARIEMSRIIEEKHSLDVTGHYARPDIFQLIVNEEPALPYR